VVELEVQAVVRYWEDANVNGKEDVNGDMIPCREGDMWCPLINLETGKILNWNPGTKARVHYKVCDAGEYYLLDSSGNRVVKSKGYYVPKLLCPNDSGFGDYIIMSIDENGVIENWRFDDADFIANEDDE
jgi:hypothetical protein